MDEDQHHDDDLDQYGEASLRLLLRAERRERAEEMAEIRARLDALQVKQKPALRRTRIKREEYRNLRSSDPHDRQILNDVRANRAKIVPDDDPAAEAERRAVEEAVTIRVSRREHSRAMREGGSVRLLDGSEMELAEYRRALLRGKPPVKFVPDA